MVRALGYALGECRARRELDRVVSRWGVEAVEVFQLRLDESDGMRMKGGRSANGSGNMLGT